MTTDKTNPNSSPGTQKLGPALNLLTTIPAAIAIKCGVPVVASVLILFIEVSTKIFQIPSSDLFAFTKKLNHFIISWTFLMAADFNALELAELCALVGVCVGPFVIDVVLSMKENNTVPVFVQMNQGFSSVLESVGLALLCMAQPGHVLCHAAGIGGTTCLVLATCQRCLSSPVTEETKPQKTKQVRNEGQGDDEVFVQSKPETIKQGLPAQTMVQDPNDETADTAPSEEDEPEGAVKNTRAVVPPAPAEGINFPGISPVDPSQRVDKVFTIGCFDLFHRGHVRLMKRMKTMGKQVYVGIHDSRSIYKLKKRVPIDSTETRMTNVKRHADVVFSIPATDPSVFMNCIIHLEKGESAIFVRGDDMPNFPSRQTVEQYMTVKLLPYTQGVSSTDLRRENFSFVKNDDEDYMNKNEGKINAERSSLI